MEYDNDHFYFKTNKQTKKFFSEHLKPLRILNTIYTYDKRL